MGLLNVGTSSFTASGWERSFYPTGTKPTDFLRYYATRFNTVEIDSTFYGIPAPATVQGWGSKTPNDFIVAAKVPQIITHEKLLIDCDNEFNDFISVMDLLGEKLGPLLFQFGYFNRQTFFGVNDFLARLRPFLKKLPAGHRFALEIRNKSWLVPQFFETLRKHNVALALIDQEWMPRPAQWFETFDPITADFTYVRWLGDRKGIEEKTRVWDKTIIDRHQELSEWAAVLGKVYKRQIQIFAYANNHYAGHSPATVEMFRDIWRTQVKEEPKRPGPLLLFPMH